MQPEVLLCQWVASLCHMEFFFSSSALIPERGKGAPADVPTPKSCECKGEPLVSVSHSCLSWVGESRRPGAARGNRKLGQAQSLCQSDRLGSIRKPANTHPFLPQADTELWPTQTERPLGYHRRWTAEEEAGQI